MNDVPTLACGAAVVALAVAGCRSHDRPAPPAQDAGGAASDPIAAVATRLDADPPATARPPIAPPAGVVAMADGYDKARRVALGVMATRAHTADAVFAMADRWNRAPEPLRRLGADARAGEVAALVAAGAAAAAAPAPSGDPAEFEAAAAAAVAHALALAERGEADRAAWTLLAAAQMGFDIARGRRLYAARHGLNAVRGALAALRAVLTASPPAEAGAVADACDRLAAGQPTVADALLAETRWYERALVAGAGRGEPPPGWTDAARAEVERLARAAGGVAAFARKLAEQRLVVADLRAPHRAGADRQRLVARRRAAIWGADHPWADPEDAGRWESARAEVAATCLVARRVAGRPAGPHGVNPVTGQPWLEVGGRLTGGTLIRHGTPEPVAIAIGTRP
ncbi:MAG: hypothetical protein D6689_13010 [Deltaproteobacteria bacterium]|nr:MAG: hypothetical protein D6689_13010 [Deltaproteobacteria bacterium]